ncbi:hypothetical protein AJ79_08582 [Helicocarpus griseus UAMH5409]|uniref:NACHT domain-containing protein n=1 Tax=Helicocarpus griseus UAMH5409 TaxID=1447875 RepID=A0A2B7WRR1_9EURO|nr:hypothetical protein AJ79_08582 [Helicocarpus griseus UAMH5409]
MSAQNNISQIPAIYREAVRKYEDITKKKLDDPALLKITSVEDLLNELDKENRKFNDFREKLRPVFNALESAMKPVERVGPLVSAASSMAFPPSSLVFASISHLINSAKGVFSHNSAILELMGELEAIGSGRFLKFGRTALIGSDGTVQEALDRLATLTKNEDRLVGAETLTETKKTGRAIDNVTSTVSATRVAVAHVNHGVAELNRKVDYLLQAEDSHSSIEMEPNPRIHDLKHILRPSVTAHDWFDKSTRPRLKEPEIGLGRNASLKHGSPILWVTGNPGSGKSYLASNIISYLGEQHSPRAHKQYEASVTYFFFKDDNPVTRFFHQALRDLAYQIIQNDSAYAKRITTTCTSPDDTSTLESAWRTLFVGYFVKEGGLESIIYIVLDAIDEAYAAERQSMLNLMKDIYNVPGSFRVRIIMFGRPQLTGPVSEALEKEVPTIHVVENKNSADIISHIEHNIRKSNILRRISTKLKSEMLTKLSCGAQGMFLWVDLMFKEF